MKIRSGFVSNSSSSSFVCPKERFESVFALGKEMLRIRNIDWKDWDGTNDVRNEELDQELIKIRRAEELGINPNTPISFSTTNYETFISVTKSRYQVSTCNNHNWDDLDVYFVEDDSFYEQKEYFWWIKEGIVGKKVTEQEWQKFLEENPEFRTTNNSEWPQCWNAAHFGTILRTPDQKIECATCYGLAKKPDMIIKPATSLKYRPHYIIKPRLRLR